MDGSIKLALDSKLINKSIQKIKYRMTNTDSLIQNLNVNAE